MVLLLLKIEVSEDIKALSITASIIPLAPGKITLNGCKQDSDCKEPLRGETEITDITERKSSAHAQSSEIRVRNLKLLETTVELTR